MGSSSMLAPHASPETRLGGPSPSVVAACTDVEEFLGQMSHAALHTRAAAELHDDADERELALEIAALRDPETNGAPD